MGSTETITRLLGELRDGHAGARDQVFQAAYPDLRRLAHARLREAGGPGNPVNPTTLVHETYLRFPDALTLRAADRRAFFSYASKIMRSVILDEFRERTAQRRGDGAVPLTLRTDHHAAPDRDEEIVLQVHEALEVLGQAHPRLAEIALLRYFGGYNTSEIASALEIGERTVDREWEKARLILLQALD